ncbi:ras association domain-containing protein 8 isoform X2 [Corythoichthys intestinalis]|uniref:ras association domain-containing protein 8 isoform X2 n=1 Tax=Corythoichthys intestinalis TaxID=161448 RepID=UPI0025A630D2|nr:ras association domain-containing protein 8 isoform X2 [Corythoichthys intestinalis]
MVDSAYAELSARQIGLIIFTKNSTKRLDAMEIKVSVDNLPRLVCGVTEETTCQEVVTVLAQALGQPGRYMLRETFKDFERCMAPNEHPLEILRKYGEHAKEVQLALLHSRPSVSDEMSRAKVGRRQPCPPLRRKEASARVWRRSESLNQHRHSLPLSCLKRDTEQKQEHLKRPKRKSLTFMEEAWEWLENLGKTQVYSTSCDTDSSKRNEKNKRSFLSITLSAVGKNPRDQKRRQRNSKSDLDHQTSCCMGTHQKVKESPKKSHREKLDISNNCEDEKYHLREMIIYQLSYLQKLQVLIEKVDYEISELEERERVREEQKLIQDEMEQIRFWEYELKAEDIFERDLQNHFHDMKAKVVNCKTKLGDYKTKMQKLGFCGDQNICPNEGQDAADDKPTNETISGQLFETEVDVNSDRKWPPRRDCNPPPADLIPPSPIKARRPTGPAELREWWARWSAVQKSKTNTMNTKIHRSELTVFLGGTKN